MITPFQNFTKDQVVWTSLRSKTATHWNRGSIPPSPCFCSSRSLSIPGRFHFKSNYIGKVNSFQFQWISKVRIYAVCHPQIAPKALKWILTRNICVLTMLLKPTSRKTKMSVFAKLMAYCEQDTLPTRSRAYHGMHCVWPVRFKQVHTGSSPWVDRTDGQWWRTGAHQKEKHNMQKMREHVWTHIVPFSTCSVRNEI